MRAPELSKDDEALIAAAGNDVYRGCESPAWSPYNLSRPQIIYWAVEQTLVKINNGGAQYFFEWEWPKNPSYVIFIEALSLIGAKESASCLQDAVDQFPFPNPELDYGKRCDFLTSSRSEKDHHDSIIDLLGKRMLDLSDDTFTKLAVYIRANIDDFPSAKKLLAEKSAGA